MSKVDEAVERFCSGAACSQAILATYGADYGLTREGLFRTICPRLVQDAAEILEEML